MPSWRSANRYSTRPPRSKAVTAAAAPPSAFENGVARPPRRAPVLCKDVERYLANARDTWQKVQDLANAYNGPGQFTTLIGYEFSSLLVDFGLLHRNVIFRVSDVIPQAVSCMHVANQKQFFARLDETCIGGRPSRPVATGYR